MKKYCAVLIILCLFVPLLTSCSGQAPDEPLPPQANGKELLRIYSYWDSVPLEDMNAEPTFDAAGITFGDLPEMDEQPYTGQECLQPFADYAADVLGTVPDGRWQIFVHYYTVDLTYGMVQFSYTIGKIGTNKSIIFSLENGKATSVAYSCLDMDTDEDGLLKRIALFEDRYEQEKLTLEEGQTFEEEWVNYTYYYNRNALMYSYNLFFADENGLINNDYGTECFIDGTGAAVRSLP